MATKKTASSKKSVAKVKAAPSVAPAKAKSTKVTTVKAVSATKPAGKLFGLRLSRAPLLGAGIAEFIGTFLLAAAFIAGQGQPIIVLFALVGIVLTVGALSGAHLNPAITIAAWATRKVKGARALVYVFAQILGAMLALVVLGSFVGQAPAVSDQAAQFGQAAPELYKALAIPADKEWSVFFAELLGATIFGFVFAAALRQTERFAYAATIGFGAFVALLVTSSAAAVVSATVVFNPAIAVAIEAIDFSSIWPVAIYVFAAALGALIGFILNDLLQVESDGGKDVIA